MLILQDCFHKLIWEYILDLWIEIIGKVIETAYDWSMVFSSAVMGYQYSILEYAISWEVCWLACIDNFVILQSKMLSFNCSVSHRWESISRIFQYNRIVTLMSCMHASQFTYRKIKYAVICIGWCLKYWDGRMSINQKSNNSKYPGNWQF